MTAPAGPAAPPATAGPRVALADSALEALVVASHTPAVQAAAAELATLETLFKGLAHNERNEETGQGRDDLVAGFRSLRAKVAVLEPALQPHFYRAMNTLSPYYYQGLTSFSSSTARTKRRARSRTSGTRATSRRCR